MGKKFLLLLLSLTLLAIPTASAEDSFWADDSSPYGQIGLVWYEDVLRSGNGISKVTAYGDGPLQAICKSASDSNCKGFKYKSLELILPVCSGSKYQFCIEGMAVGNGKDAMVEGDFIRAIKGNTVAEDKKLGTPYGGTATIWNVPGQEHTGGNSNYSVSVRLRYVGVGDQLDLNAFEASVVPFREETGDQYKFMEAKVLDTQSGKQIVHDWHVGNCIWQEPGLCGVATRWSDGAVASLSLRVPDIVTGWLHGRLESPEIDVKKIDSQTNRITVQAKPVTVQGSAPKVNVDQIPDSLLKVITYDGKVPLQGGSGYVWQMEPSDYNFDWFNAWFPMTNDKADGLTDYWNFKSITGDFGTQVERKCLSNTERLIGLVTTNSLWYSGNPPKFSKSELIYKVAALHFQPDGVTPFLGSYDLVLDSKAARCLYGYSSAPIQASLSIVSANGEKQVATTTLTEQKGWLRLSAKGFTFSSPSIKIRLTQKNSSASKSISCQKGKTLTQVRGLKPVCPPGYTKK